MRRLDELDRVELLAELDRERSRRDAGAPDTGRLDAIRAELADRGAVTAYAIAECWDPSHVVAVVVDAATAVDALSDFSEAEGFARYAEPGSTEVDAIVPTVHFDGAASAPFTNTELVAQPLEPADLEQLLVEFPVADGNVHRRAADPAERRWSGFPRIGSDDGPSKFIGGQS